MALNKDFFYSQYVIGKKSISSLAKEHGISYWAIRELLHKFGIPVRTSFEGRALKTKEIKWVVDGSGCWICTSHWQLKKGYYMIVRNKKQYLLHRYLYMSHYGLSDENMRGLVVMHTCDNPACINIDHLRLGTQKENMQDMMSKGRRGNTKCLTR